jgi:hypothetical protein
LFVAVAVALTWLLGNPLPILVFLPSSFLLGRTLWRRGIRDPSLAKDVEAITKRLSGFSDEELGEMRRVLLLRNAERLQQLRSCGGGAIVALIVPERTERPGPPPEDPPEEPPTNIDDVTC